MRRTVRLSIVLAALTTGLVSSGCGTSPWPPEDKLDEVARAIEGNLDTLDADMANAAAGIAQTGLDGDATRATLSALSTRYPQAADCATISPAGILVAVEPAAYQDAEGANVSDQAQVMEALQGQPVMSDLFTAVEGFPAMDYEYPLMANSVCTGTVSMLLKPADYFAGIIEPLVDGTDCTGLVLQLDGVILYDADASQVGLNTFTDPLYADYAGLQEFAHVCVSTSTGAGTYRFTDSQTGDIVMKFTRWTTVEFHGAQWRVLLIKTGPAMASWYAGLASQILP